MATPDAAIIIPHYNDPERLARCLQALQRNDLSGVDILVVDNNSPQPLTAEQARFPEVRFVVETEKGAAAARNRGVAETKAPLLFFIDADCVAADDWVAMAHEAAPTADLIGGRVDVFDETPPPRSGAEAFEAVFAFNFQNYIEVQGFTGTGNLVTTREVFTDVGGFRGGVSEDLDWSTRAVSKGYKLIYREDLVVSHPSRSDWAALRHKWLRLTQELFGVNGKTPRDRVKWALRAFAMPVSAIVHAPKVLGSEKLNGPVEKLRGLGTLFRLRFQRMIWMLQQAAGQEI